MTSKVDYMNETKARYRVLLDREPSKTEIKRSDEIYEECLEVKEGRQLLRDSIFATARRLMVEHGTLFEEMDKIFPEALFLVKHASLHIAMLETDNEREFSTAAMPQLIEGSMKIIYPQMIKCTD